MQLLLNIVVMRMGDCHQIDFADILVVVRWSGVFSPERVGLFLHIFTLTYGTSSMIPLRILFLYSSNICRSRTVCASLLSLYSVNLWAGASGTKFLGLRKDRGRMEVEGLMCLLWSRR